MKNLKDLEPAGKNKKARKKVQRWIDEKRRHLRVLIRYLDKDYAQIKKTYVKNLFSLPFSSQFPRFPLGVDDEH
jgi:hypothetical protein